MTAKCDASEDEADSRFLAKPKSNIGPDGGGFVYDVAQTELQDRPGVIASFIQWGKALDGTARELLAIAERQDDQGTCDTVSFLHELLLDGPMVVKEIKCQADDSGFAWRTVQRAMKKAGVESKRGGFGLSATWFISSRATVAPFAPTILSGATGATDTEMPLSLPMSETQHGKVYF